jgi:hypothetical protein
MRRLALASLSILLVGPAPLAAQDDAQPTKWTDVEWYTVTQVDFVNGKQDEALKIIREHFIPAADAAGTPGPVMVLMNVTGEWDMTVIWKMKDGPADMEWRRSPDNIKWWKAAVELAGSEEAAEKLGEEYSSYVQRASSTLTRTMSMGS